MMTVYEWFQVPVTTWGKRVLDVFLVIFYAFLLGVAWVKAVEYKAENAVLKAMLYPCQYGDLNEVLEIKVADGFIGGGAPVMADQIADEETYSVMTPTLGEWCIRNGHKIGPID